MSGTKNDNDAHLKSFIEGAKAGEPTMRDYVTKLTKQAKEAKFDGPESSLISGTFKQGGNPKHET
jgi:hypothetical protein